MARQGRPLQVRELHPDEVRTFLEVHHAAVRVTAAADYPAEVIEAWAPLPITDALVQQVRNSHEGEIRLAAILDGEIIGIGALVPQNNELRACYVSPEHGRVGAGRALVDAIEHIAQQRGLTYLAMDSSITAELSIFAWATRSWAAETIRCAEAFACAAG